MPDLQACYNRIYAIVRRIPAGKVMTYGQIARLVLDVCTGPVPAITVGRAMAASGRYADDIPWWRVIGGVGDVGVLRKATLGVEQRDRLAAEGVIADDEGGYDLRQYRYEPSSP